MPPKSGLLGTLSTIALGVGLAVSSAGDAAAQAKFIEICGWINAEKSVERLQTILTKLQTNAEECYFDPVTGKSYCKACIEQAASKIVALTSTAAGGGAFVGHGPG